MIIVYSIILIILLILSGFFSSSETAYLSINKLSLKKLAKENTKKSNLVIRLKKNTDKLLTTILIGNNLVNTLASTIATALAISLMGDKGTGIAVIVMTILIVLLGEILPKTIAMFNPLQIAKQYSFILSALEFILTPLSYLFLVITKFFSFLENKIRRSSKKVITEDELKTLIDVGNSEGTLENGEKEMLYKIFEFTDLKIQNIMRHRSLITAVPDTYSLQEIVDTFIKSGYSRLPVYKDNLDNIIGLIHYKDILFSSVFKNNKEDFLISNVIRNVLFVPERQSAESLLHLFKSGKHNFAIVVDEHGSNCGIITLDDILKAVFGRITDEYTSVDIPPEDRIQVISSHEIRIPGDIPISVINTMLQTDYHSEDFTTFGGYLLERFGYLPSSGEYIKDKKVIFTVEDQAQRRIKTIRINF